MKHAFHRSLQRPYYWSVFLVAVFSLFIFLSGQINFPGPQVILEAQAQSDYGNELQTAIGKVLANNPDGIADKLNTKENSFIFLDLVAAQLRVSGFNATTNVLNGNNNPNTGNLIALWRTGDTTIERYDAIKDAGLGDKPIAAAVQIIFTGDIPLNCADGGGSNNCADPAGSGNEDGSTLNIKLENNPVARGQMLQISGQNLPENVKLTNASGTVITIKGTITEAGTNLIVNIPNTITPGIYAVTVSGNNGSFEVPQRLTITDGKSIVPSFSIRNSPTTSLGDLIGLIFNYSLQVLGLVVFIMILFSGFQWLLAGGNPGTISKARARITNALLGAIILLASYLILNTINPDLVKGGFKLEGINVPKGEGTEGDGTEGETLASKAQNLINRIGIGSFSTNAGCGNNFNAKQNIQDVASEKVPAVCSPTCSDSNPCLPGGVSGTVSINPKILDGLMKLANRGFNFTVTSFTTGKHDANSSHYTGNAVDIVINPANSSNASAWIEARTALNGYGGYAICEDPNGKDVQSCSPIPSVVSHIHWQL